jgi:hypothetical protein
LRDRADLPAVSEPDEQSMETEFAAKAAFLNASSRKPALKVGLEGQY